MGSPEAALEPLIAALEGEPPGDRHRHILFALGEAYGDLGDRANAVDFYLRYLDEDDTIAGYVRPLIGDSYVMLGELTLAIRQYELALQEEMPASIRAGTMESLADIALQQQDYLGAIGWYDEILAMSHYPDYRSRILYQAALAHQQAGQPDQALSLFHESINNYPDTYHAYLSLEALLALGSPVDEFTRGMVDYYNGIYEGAIAAFHRYIEAHPDAAGGSPWYYSGLSYGELGRYPEAWQELDKVIWGDPTDAYFGRAWMAAARLRGWAGDVDGAIDVYHQFAASHPANAWADDALWEAANLMRDAQRMEEAAQIYLHLQESYPDSEYATRAFFQAGLCAYRVGDYDQARQAWQSLEAIYPWSDWVVPSLLWRGKAHLAQGDGLNANALLGRVADLDAHSYYGYRSLDLSGVLVRSETSMPLEAEEEVGERSEFETWLVDWAAPVASTETLSDLSPALAGDDDLAKGRELWAVGRHSEAASHFRAVRDRYGDDAVSLYQLCLLFREEGVFDLAISCGAFILDLSPAESVLDAPAWLRRMIYPTLFSDLVIPEAQARDVDPLLFLAMIRQESRFNPFATSYADARGLTQVIPDTANYIAAKMGSTDVTPSDMYRPMVSVRFGVYYLAEQIRRFDGDIFSALAAYNGGPTNAERWHDPDVDILVENIRFRETRAYVQAIYKQYSNYRALYSAP